MGQGALNPDAEQAALQRYRQAKARLQSDLKDQILTRTETLDKDKAALEYARETTELLGAEAKVSGTFFSTWGFFCLNMCIVNG